MTQVRRDGRRLGCVGNEIGCVRCRRKQQRQRRRQQRQRTRLRYAEGTVPAGAVAVALVMIRRLIGRRCADIRYAADGGKSLGRMECTHAARRKLQTKRQQCQPRGEA